MYRKVLILGRTFLFVAVNAAVLLTTHRSAERGAGVQHASANERATNNFPVCFAPLLRRRYISSRRKKFNVAVKADGNADCGLWASPVTTLHRTVHISRECSVRPSVRPSRSSTTPLATTASIWSPFPGSPNR